MPIQQLDEQITGLAVSTGSRMQCDACDASSVSCNRERMPHSDRQSVDLSYLGLYRRYACTNGVARVNPHN